MPTVISTISSAFSVRYEQNPHFIGRDELLDQLFQELSDHKPKRYNHRIALYGLGGVGKTQVALEYAYRHESDYKYVFWISAVDKARLLSGYVEIAGQIQLTTEVGKPLEIAKSVLNWFRVTKGWLLIIDNLDDITVVDGCLPAINGAGHTLITTRNKNSEDIPAGGIEVPVMDTANSVQFLLDRIQMVVDTSDPEIQENARRIVNELGFLPLAIEQAGAYIRVSQNMSEYLTTYKSQPRELLNWRSGGNYLYNFTVATTWRMSLKRLQVSHPISITLIQYFAFMNPDEIILEFLKTGIGVLPPRMQAVLGNNLRMRESLNALESFSLIRVFGGGEKISIHRLTQVVIQDDLDALLRSQIMSDILRLGLNGFPDIRLHETQRETCRRYRSQVVSFLEHARNAKQCKEWQLLSDRVAYFLREDGFYTDALHWERLTLDARTEVLGPQHPDTLQSIDGLAWSHLRLGQRQTAAHLHEETLQIRKRILGLEHPHTLWSMYGLAWSYQSLGRRKEALQLHEDTLEIRKRVLGSEHGDTLKTMDGLAWSYHGLGWKEKAAQLHKNTLDIRKKVFGTEHPNTLKSMYGLAWSYYSLKQMTEAASLHEQTLVVRKRVLGPEHPHTLRTMDGLAWAYHGLHRKPEAERLHDETLKIRKRVLGSEHPDTLESMIELYP